MKTQQLLTQKMAEQKPAVLVLGGTGTVGRHLVRLLVESNSFGKIRVADKKMPVTSFLDNVFKAVFDNPIVEFKQVNLSSTRTYPSHTFLPTHVSLPISQCEKGVYSREQ